jgi:hypothetical protein
MGGGCGGWIEIDISTRWRSGHIVVDLDLEEKTARKEKPRIGSAISASTVEEHQRARVRVQP